MMNNFPEFTKLELDDKSEYLEQIRQYPPYSDLSFTTMMVWWNLGNKLEVASLNDNLVISYDNPYDEINSGLCIVGRTAIAGAIGTLFEYQRERDMPQRLVHIPEFVIAQVVDSSDIEIIEEPGYDEYIIAVDRLYPLETITSDARRKIKRFTEAVGADTITTASIDLTDQQHQALLLERSEAWKRPTSEEVQSVSNESEAMIKSFEMAEELEIQNICLYVADELVGFATYHVSHDGQYYIGGHMKAKNIPYIFNYLEYLVAGVAKANGVKLLNIEMDLGLPGLRAHKKGLRPVDFLRKYTIRPV